MVKVLVLGGTGFIGFNLIKYLVKRKDCQITVVDNLSRGKHDQDFKDLLKQHPSISFQEGDLTESITFSRLANNYDYIYHLAAIVGVSNVADNPDKVLRVNILSTLNLLEWLKNSCKNLKRLLFTSTSEIYAETLRQQNQPIPTPETITLTVDNTYPPRSTYALSKILGESATMVYARKHAFPVTIVRFHNIYGPRMGYSHVIPELLIRAFKEEISLGVYSVNHTRAFCYIEDAAEATIRLAENPEAISKIVHVGNSKEEISIDQLAKYIIEIVKPHLTVKSLGEHEGSPVRRCPDTSELIRLTGLSPKTTLREGLRKTWDWYKDHLG